VLKGGVLIEVRIFGSEPPCVYCKRTEEAAKKAAALFPGRVSVEKHSAHSPEAAGAGFTATPAVIVNGKVVSQGRVPQQSELEDLFRSELGG
jgi:protein-disulfide isomerase